MKHFSIVVFFVLAFLCFSTETLFAQAEKFIKDTHNFHEQTIPYQLFVPDTLETGEKYPLILALHGSGRRGDNNNHVEISPYLWSWARDVIQQEHPCFVLVPQCPEKKLWIDIYHAVGDIIDSLNFLYPVDSTRIYVTGYSLGGIGSWSYALKYPLRFAAAVPCAGTAYEIKSTLKYISYVPAIWSFHGSLDDQVPVSEARGVVDSMIVNGFNFIKTQGMTDNELDNILATNPSYLYTEYPDIGHLEIDERVYFNNPRLVDWLFNQQDLAFPLSDPVYPTNTAVQSSEPPIDFPFVSEQPVFSYGSSGTWDDGGVRWPAIIQDGDTLRMWYTGLRPDRLTASMGYAWSLDGTTWHRYSGNPVLSPTLDWEGLHIGACCVIEDNGEYKMWYAGNIKGGWTTTIGFATSSDGINWTKHPTPVLFPGSADDWDYINIRPGTVIKVDNQYMMWYEGGNWPTHYQIGLATSTDGITWTKYNDAQTNDIPYANSDPVISYRSSWGDWDRVWKPMVIKNDDGYSMLYAGSDLYKQIVYYASSDDGIIWTKYADHPVFSQIPSWADFPYYDTGTLLESSDGRLHFWYTCYIYNFDYYWAVQPRIGYATDLKDLPIVRSIELDRTFIRTDIDTLKIKAQVVNTIGHNISVQAKFYNDNTTFTEYTLLYDDGEHGDDLAQDSIYGGSWVCPEENVFSIIVEINDLSNGYTYNSYMPFNLEEHVTSIGPLVYDYHYFLRDTSVNPGDILTFKLALRNVGTSMTAENVTAHVTSSDSRGEITYVSNDNFGDIAVGQSAESAGFYRLKLDTAGFSYPNDTLYLDLSISSNGNVFWNDSSSLPIVVGIEQHHTGNLPTKFALVQNYPNPFNPMTTISYQLPMTSEVKLSIYNLLGQKVATLVNERQPAGHYQVKWDASGMASGVYYYQLKTAEFEGVKKMILIR